jgi:ureidoacrylate peracid hydrolase
VSLAGIAATAAAAEGVHPTKRTTFDDPPVVPLRPIVLNARPAPITIDPAHTALLVVDMQNDFGSEGGMFDRMGIDVSIIQRVVPPIARVLDSARGAGMKVVYLKMGFRSDLADLGAPGSPNRERHLSIGVGKSIQAPDGRESRILIRDTWGTDIVPGLQPEAGDVVIYKHRHSGFFETKLDETLQQMGIKFLIVTGCTTSICVGTTVQDAAFRDYSCIVLSDCTTEPIGYGLPRSNHDASLLAIEAVFGWVCGSDELIGGFDDNTTPADSGLGNKSSEL